MVSPRKQTTARETSGIGRHCELTGSDELSGWFCFSSLTSPPSNAAFVGGKLLREPLQLIYP